MTVSFSNLSTVRHILRVKREQMLLDEITIMLQIEEMILFSYNDAVHLSYSEMKLIQKYGG